MAKGIICQQVKIEHQRSTCLLQPLEIPQWKWDQISMDFVDRLTKSSPLLPVKFTYKTSQYADLFISKIVKLHGVPVSIGSDRDPFCISQFLGSVP